MTLVPSIDPPASPQHSFAPYAAATATGWHRRAEGAAWVVAEGSLAKVDLSGFTRLSERLARSETTGAETLNAVLTDVFGELIEEVLSRGGDILQFGGDALLIWFEGPDHALRAAGACRMMQRRLADRPAERTPAGTVRLRMSAAVASGPLVLTVVGRDHRELLSFGPVASRTEQVEKHARSGELLVDAATAAQLPGRSLRPRPDGLVRVVGLLPSGTTRRTPPAGEAAEDFVPPDVRALERLGVPAGEHRRAAVAFVGVTGLDALVEGGDTATAVARVSEVAAAVDAAVDSVQVAWTAVDVMGDGVVFLLFSGAPVAREDDEERMLRACRIIADRCAGGDVRIGANVGRVFAADIGHPERRTFAAIGDTTNLAARLMHRAGAGEVLVSAELFAGSHRDHEVTWLDPFPVKGLRRQVVAGRLGPRAGSEAGGRRRTHDLPLVGREDERRRLHALVDLVALRDESTPVTRDPSDSSLVLVGEAGVGKSRLVIDALAHADEVGASAVRAAATPFDRDSPYAALRRPLREALGLDGEDDVGVVAGLVDQQDLLSLLGPPLGFDLVPSPAVSALDPRFVEARRHELLADALLAAARGRGGLLLVLEDLHWFDRASTGLARTLAARAGVGALSLLLTSRVAPAELWEDAGAICAVPVEPLPAAASEQLVVAALGEQGISDAALARVVSDAAGNPLFLRELVAHGPDKDALPASAEEVIAARIDELGPERRRVLRESSVGGSVQGLRDAAQIVGDPTLQRREAWSALGDFVTVEDDPGGTQPKLRFHHELYRQVAYRGLAVRRRRELHARAADLHLTRIASAIHGPDGRRAPSALTSAAAIHLHEAQRFEEAWRWSLQAAHEARASGALHDATALFERAVDSGRRAHLPEGEIATVLEEYADVAELVGEYDRAADALLLASRHGDALSTGRRRAKRAVVLERQGRYRTALAELTRAEHVFEGASSPTDGPAVDEGLTSVALRRSSVLHRLGRLRRAYAVAERVADSVSASSGQGGAPVPSYEQLADRARALLRMEMIASEAGLPQRFDLGAQALIAFDGLDEDRDLACLLGNIGVTAIESGDWNVGRRRYEESIEVYQRAGDVVGAAIAANNTGEILCEQGYLDRAAEVFGRARRVFRAAGHAWGTACTASALGRVAARQGDLVTAATLLDEAVTSLDALGSAVFAADARARVVEARLLEDAVSAIPAARELVDLVANAEVGQVLLLTAERYLATALAAAGELDAAEELARSLVLRAAEHQATHEESLALDLMAGLDVMRGREPDGDVLARRDELWCALGIVWSPHYPPVPSP